MKKIRKTINHRDERGYIQDILVQQPVEHTAYIFSKEGSVRGNHYHKETIQFTYVLEGKIEYHFQSVKGERGVEVLEAGDIIESPAMEYHALKALEDTRMFIFTRGPRGGDDYEKDTFRLSPEEKLVTS